MSHTEGEPRSAFTILNIAQNDIELDKTRDGRYWRLLYWLERDVLLQLLISHTCCEDPNDFIAQVKAFGSDDDLGGRSEQGFTTLSEFMFAPVQLEDTEPCLDGFPDVCRDEFITMVSYWGRVLEVMECGSTPGFRTLDNA